mmetsp:Transcript_11068/g.22914  ORF Transcript_11068/g.22914 Transcript_11068/m.22914 type:complete len:289 (-) Transcript_11068:98-964(-)
MFMGQKLYRLTPSNEQEGTSPSASCKCGARVYAGVTVLIALLASTAIWVAHVEHRPWTSEQRPSLFCFVLMLSDTYEALLLKEQSEQGAGVFGCDDYSVFSDTDQPLGSTAVRPEVVPGPLHVAKDPRYNFALNTRVFLRVWERVFARAAFARRDWTVKVDPDTVFLPGRLREHLRRGPSPRQRVFLVNCRFGLHGPLEVLSRPAVSALEAGLRRCRAERAAGLDTEGEDMYLAACLKLLGVRGVEDFGLLSDAACMERPFPCTSGRPAFHPLKRVDKYRRCLAQAEE